MKILNKMRYITTRLSDVWANDGKAVPLAVKQGASILLCP